MPTTSRRTRLDPAAAILRAYSASARMNGYLVERLDPAVWRATLTPVPSPVRERGTSGKSRGTRTIAALFVHMHNCGLVYLDRTDPTVPVPAELDRFRATPKQVARAFAAKRRAVLRIAGDALAEGRRIVGSPHDATSYLLYYMAHDNHHRGQVLLLSRLLGYPVDVDTMSGLWQWNARAGE